MICFAKEIKLVFSDIRNNADAQSGAGERVSFYEMIRYPQLTPHLSHFIFEQLPHRLNQRQIHFLWKSADIMVGFDGSGGTFKRDTFNHIRIEGSLGQEFEIIMLRNGFIKDINENITDNFSLFFRIHHSPEPIQETSGGVYPFHRQMQILFIEIQDIPKLILSQQAVVHKY